MQHPFLSFSLVGVQFAALLYLVLTSPLTLSSPLPFVFFFGGILLSGSALFVMRKSHWNIRPDVPEQNRLITAGPYAIIRHPMYTAIILVAIGLFLETPDTPRLVALIILILDLNIKYRYEEYLLKQAYPGDYPAYRARTQALIPFIY